ncbi:MAG: cytochrome C [Acidobacteria bacterium]|nr:MAG: cytochrome C [Acidobacteriota bacterium]
MLRTAFRVVVGLLAIVGAIAVVGGASFAARGISAKTPPGRLETVMARRLRSRAIPRAAREQQNPIPASADAIKGGMEHFADHCAVCHANDGSGDTEMGRGMSPRAPDMRQAATQNLTDGELFYIIENGVRLTGMPAWGGGSEHDADDNWRLVRFIRHLPKVTQPEIETMKGLNPKSPEEYRQDEETHRFLQGGAAPKTPPPHQHTHGGKG